MSDRVLVVGYGNPLRRDDGVGWRVAQAIADRWAGRVTVRMGQQLVPEWAADVAEADVAFIVDACATSVRLRLRLLTPAIEPSLLDAHALGPSDLIGLAEVMYGRRPRAYLLQLPAEDFGFGDAVSRRAAAGVQHAIRVLDHRLARLVLRQADVDDG